MIPTDEIASARDVCERLKDQGYHPFFRTHLPLIEALASRLEQALSTGPAHDAGLIEAKARVEAYSRPGEPMPMLRLARAYQPIVSFDESFAELLADLRLILQALAGESR